MYAIVIAFTMLAATHKRTRWPESLNAHSHTHETKGVDSFQQLRSSLQTLESKVKKHTICMRNKRSNLTNDKASRRFMSNRRDR